VPGTVAPLSSPIRVLLIDDEPFIRAVLEALLGELPNRSFVVDWCGSYADGLEAIRRPDIDVCLLDFQLGATSGIDFLREVTSLGCRVPIIMLTGQGDQELDVVAMKSGAADYLVKGEFNAQTLERSLRYAIERAKTLEALSESQERYALAVAGANDGIWDWEPTTGSIYFSLRWKEIIGYQDHEIPNELSEWFLRVHPEDVGRLKADLKAHETGTTSHFENEHRILHKDGTYRWVLCRGLAVRGKDGRATRFAGSQSDVTQSRGHDPLTGLPNRTLYMDRLERALERGKRCADYSFAVLFLDLDRFKIINDSLGHIAGDQLLVDISNRLKLAVRTADTVARLGGDEFTILLVDTVDANEVTRVALRVQEELSKPFNLGGREVFTSASIGIAMGSSTYARAEEILRDADIAMYRAKSHGKARHELFDAGMHERAVALLKLETALRRAVENLSFKVLYQPIIHLGTGKVVSVEALVRWNDPQRGLIPPDEFIPLAEETGLIVQIDRFVTRTACQQQLRWAKKFPQIPVSVAVNVSKRQFEQPDFIEDIGKSIAETGIDPARLVLEITESVIMPNPEQASKMLGTLRSRNVQLAMDDFGTGYSSLSHLHQLPFSSLKIDRSFVKKLGSPEGSTTEIVRAIIAVARSLKVQVTAEGIETEEQLALLRSLECGYGQGYFFSRPTDEAGIDKILSEAKRW
jgi:diguanylate cyclase (GGDEF)-like protein/PAS domain S-box-containing protein